MHEHRPVGELAVSHYRFENGTNGASISPALDSVGGNNLSLLGAATYSSASLPYATIPATGAANTLGAAFPASGNNGLVSAVNGTLATTEFTDFTIEAFVRFSDLAGTQTTRIKGNRMRIDSTQGDKTSSIILDFDGQRMITLDDKKREATVMPAARLQEALGKTTTGEVKASVTPTAETKTIAGITCKRNYQLDAPQGVRGRNSDNTKINEVFGWEPSISLADGMARTYAWVYDQVKRAHG